MWTTRRDFFFFWLDCIQVFIHCFANLKVQSTWESVKTQPWARDPGGGPGSALLACSLVTLMPPALSLHSEGAGLCYTKLFLWHGHLCTGWATCKRSLTVLDFEKNVIIIRPHRICFPLVFGYLRGGNSDGLFCPIHLDLDFLKKKNA